MLARTLRNQDRAKMQLPLLLTEVSIYSKHSQYVMIPFSLEALLVVNASLQVLVRDCTNILLSYRFL